MLVLNISVKALLSQEVILKVIAFQGKHSNDV